MKRKKASRRFYLFEWKDLSSLVGFYSGSVELVGSVEVFFPAG